MWRLRKGRHNYIFGQLIEKHAGLSQWPDSTLRFDREKPRSIVTFGDSHTKEDVLRSAWQKKEVLCEGYDFFRPRLPWWGLQKTQRISPRENPQQPDSRQRFSCCPRGARRAVTKPEWRLIIHKKANASAAEKLRVFRRDTDDWRVQIVLQIWYYSMVMVTLLSRVVNSVSYFSFFSVSL